MRKLITLLSLLLCCIVTYAQQTTSNVQILRDSVEISSLSNVRIKANGKVYYNDKEVATKGEAARSATIVVAASNASAKSKVAADIVCTGTDDQVKIREAVEMIASSGVGGKIQLTEGDYNFNNGAWLLAINNDKVLSITLEGMGSSTILHRRFISTDDKAQGLFVFGLTTNPNITNKYVTTIKNVKYNGHMDVYAQPAPRNQTFCTSYTDRSDVLETTVLENIVCENVDSESYVFVTMGSHAILKSLDLGNAHNEYGISVVPSSNQPGSVINAVIEHCMTPAIRLFGGNKSFVTNNLSKSIYLTGQNIVCTGNIYNGMQNNITASLVTNNLQVSMP